MVARLVALAGWLLGLYPSAFRATFGEEMLRVLAQRLVAAVPAGRWAMLRVGLHELIGLLRGALVEQWRGARSGDGLAWLAGLIWCFLAGLTLFWGWAMLAISLDDGVTPRGSLALALLGLVAVGLLRSWRPTVHGGLIVLGASLGLFGVMLWGAVETLADQPMTTIQVLGITVARIASVDQLALALVIAVLFPLPWLAASYLLLLIARRRRALARRGER